MLARIGKEVRLFCGLTGLHGFAYVVSGRNRAETVVWALALLASLSGAGLVCFEAFYTWTEQPVVNVIQSFQHDISQIPAPAIAICPVQFLDELYHVSLMLNRLEFRCRANAYAKYVKFEGVEPCGESHMRAIRRDDSPFYAFLEQLKLLVKDAVQSVGGEIDWASLGTAVVPLREGLVKDLILAGVAEMADYERIPQRPEMPLDEQRWTLENMEYVCQEMAETFDHIIFPYEGAALIPKAKTCSLLALDENFLGKKPTPRPGEVNDLIQELHEVQEKFHQIGYLRGLKHSSTFISGYTASESNNTGFKRGHELWRDITKGYALMRRLSDVGLGTLIRQYLPQMRTKNKEENLTTLLTNLTKFTSNQFAQSPIEFVLAYDNKERQANEYFLEATNSQLATAAPFTEERIVTLLRNIRFAQIGFPVPQSDQVDQEYQGFFTVPVEWKEHDLESLNVTDPEVESYKMSHYLDTLVTDMTASPVSIFLLLEDAVFSALDDIVAIMLDKAKAKVHPVKSYQVGAEYTGLSMIPYSSEQALLRQTPTMLGICSVLDAVPIEGVMKSYEMLPYLKRFFHLPHELEQRKYSNLSDISFLLDMHNTDLGKSAQQNESYFLISVGPPDTYFANLDQHIVVPGTTSFFKVMAQLQTADTDVKTFDFDKRNCLFREENQPDSFFNAYTKETCTHECALKVTLNSTGCVPWDVVFPFKPGHTHICSGREAGRFKSRLLDEQHKCLKNCPELCEYEEFQVNVDTILTDVNLACRNKVYFQSVQNAEQENVFAFSKSVADKYLIGDTLIWKYCKERMEKDIAVLKIQFSSTMAVLSNRERVATQWDQFGLIGGALGLFNGCSVMVFMEILQLMIWIPFSSTLRQGSMARGNSSEWSLFKVAFSYLSFSSIHGMQYIESTKFALGKALWAAIVMGFLGVGSVLARFSSIDFEENQVIRSLDLEAGQVTELTYPAITICPVQLNDNWNLVQGMLNTRDFRSHKTGAISQEIFREYQEFFELLISHLWMHEDDVVPETVTNQPLFDRLLPYFVFNRDSELLAKRLAFHTLNGSLDSLEPRHYEDSGYEWYEIDLGDTASWRSVVVLHGEDRAAISLFGSHQKFPAGTQESIACEYYDMHITSNLHQLECKAAVTSRYIRVKSNRKLSRVGPVAFSPKCRGADEGFPRPGYYFKHTCFYEHYNHEQCAGYAPCPSRTRNVDYTVKDEFLEFYYGCMEYTSSHRTVYSFEQLHDCYERFNFSHWKSCLSKDNLEEYFVNNWGHKNGSKTIEAPLAICGPNGQCLDSMKRLWQVIRWHELKPSKLGTLLHHFSETAIKGTFHPSGEFQANQMLLAQRSIEKKIMKGLANLLSAFLEEEIDVTLIEIPVLLEASMQANRDVAPTPREIGSKQLHYSAMKVWENETFGQRNPSYSFHFKDKARVELKFDLNSYEYLIQSLVRDVMATMTPNASALADLQLSEGLSVINKLYENNYFSYQLSRHLFNVMKVMRFSQVNANIFASARRLTSLLPSSGNWTIRDYSNRDSRYQHLPLYTHVPLTSGDLVEMSTYLQTGQHDLEKSFWLDNTWTRLEMLQHCSFDALFSSSAECRTHFRHVLTEQGICSALNSAPLSTIYQADDLLYVKQVEDLYNIPSADDLFLIPGSGRRHKLALLLDTHQTDVFGSESGSFTLALNSYLDAFAMSAAFAVYPAHKSDVHVQATVVSSDEDVQSSVNTASRNCRYRDEPISPASSAFRHYTQKSCQFECRLGWAKRQMDCIPWNILHTNDELTRPICTLQQIGIFQELMSNASVECMQGCPENCEELIYDYSIDRLLIDPGVACMDNHLLTQSLMGIIEKHDRFFWEYQRRNMWYYTTHRSHLPTEPLDRCIQKAYVDYAFVNVIIASDKVPVSVMSRKYAYIDQLSIIGGTMGFWTGFSLMSGIESCFWLFIAVTFKLYVRIRWQALPGD